MARKKVLRTTKIIPARPASYDGILADVVNLLESARRASARTVNAIMTATYWQIGRRIVEHEQRGAGRAEYGEELLRRLSQDLTARFGRGFGFINLSYMRRFYAAWPVAAIVQTASEQSEAGDSISILQTPSEELARSIVQTPSAEFSLAALAQRFPLP